MNSIRKAILLGVSSYAIGLLFSSAVDADAAVRRQHSSECHHADQDGGENSTFYNGTYLGNQGQFATFAYCPVHTDTTLLHHSVTYISVRGLESATNGSFSKACVHDYDSSSTACGAEGAWATGAGVQGVDVSAWTANPAWYPYMIHNLTPSSWLYGFYTQG